MSHKNNKVDNFNKESNDFIRNQKKWPKSKLKKQGRRKESAQRGGQ